MKKLLLLLALLMLGNANFNAFAETSELNAAKMREKLSQAKTSSDSIKILYDEFDFQSQKDRIQTGREIYEIATRTGNHPVRLDILRLISVAFQDEKTLNLIEDEMKKIPESQLQKEAIEFVKMRKIAYKAKHIPEKERQREIVKVLHGLEKYKNKDLLRQILDYYTLVEFLRNDANGDMLKQYVDHLLKLVDSPEIKSEFLKNTVYSEVASIYSDSGDYEKALAANKKSLEMVGILEKSYRDKGRDFRSYDISRYEIYRRMLRNYRVLNRDEIEKYYAMALELANINSDVKEDIESNPRITAYYFMATGKYKDAIPLLKKVLANTASLPLQKQLLEELIEASKRTGDTASQIEALEKYSSLLAELNELQAKEKSRELQIKFDLKDLKDRNHDLEVENKEQQVDSARSIMTLVTVAFVIILIVLIFMMINWGRYKKNTSRMGLVVDNMHNERHKLRSTIYNDNYDIDPLAAEEISRNLRWNNRMKERGEKTGDATIFMTESIINDLLYIAWVGHRNLTKHIIESTVDKIIHDAETKAKEDGLKGAPVHIDYPQKDFTIHTDGECLVALVAHLFKKTANYGDTTEVKVKIEKHDDKNFDLVFTLMGNPPASSKGIQIFKDMPISDILLNHKNSGMYVCRFISMLMQCELIPDKTYEAGARYIIRIPIAMEG